MNQSAYLLAVMIRIVIPIQITVAGFRILRLAMIKNSASHPLVLSSMASTWTLKMTLIMTGDVKSLLNLISHNTTLMISAMLKPKVIQKSKF